MEANKGSAEKEDFTLMLFAKNLAEHFYFAIETLGESGVLISAKYKGIDLNKEFDKIAILEVIKIKNLLQYIETVGAYCLACQKDNRKDFSNVLLKYKVKEIHDFFSKIETLSNEELNDILSFCDSSYWISKSDSTIIEERIQRSQEKLRDNLLQIKDVWNPLHDFYNASKHGGRWWMHEVKHRVSGGRLVGIQWLKPDGSIDTYLEKIEDLNLKILKTAKICKNIMNAIYHNRKLIWSNNPPIDPNKYIYIE